MRFAGIALFPALLVEWWLGKRQRRNLIPLILIPLSHAIIFYTFIFERELAFIYNLNAGLAAGSVCIAFS